MVKVMASATVHNNVYAPGMTHAPNNTSAPSILPPPHTPLTLILINPSPSH